MKKDLWEIIADALDNNPAKDTVAHVDPDGDYRDVIIDGRFDLIAVAKAIAVAVKHEAEEL